MVKELNISELKDGTETELRENKEEEKQATTSEKKYKGGKSKEEGAEEA